MNFSNWLSEFEEALEGRGDCNVPCEDCVGCCTSSYFVHIKPTDKESIKRIPPELMFAAPGLPEGHYVLGYDDKGHCPMFRVGKCSIYEYRPETCRQYDCRVFAVTGTKPESDRKEIFFKSETWQIDVSSSLEKKVIEAIRTSARFLKKYNHLFPKGYIPSNHYQQAVLSLRIHAEFVDSVLEDTEEQISNLVNLIVSKYTHQR
ncbi:MAG: YkgJ family cysteine cluster protein [Gammaproteobacteria bacterium]|nr:YkgJ family cysteine cluster protein [Gammaproteobacteria bacterium]